MGWCSRSSEIFCAASVRVPEYLLLFFRKKSFIFSLSKSSSSLSGRNELVCTWKKKEKEKKERANTLETLKTLKKTGNTEKHWIKRCIREWRIANWRACELALWKNVSFQKKTKFKDKDDRDKKKRRFFYIFCECSTTHQQNANMRHWWEEVETGRQGKNCVFLKCNKGGKAEKKRKQGNKSKKKFNRK